MAFVLASTFLRPGWCHGCGRTIMYEDRFGTGVKDNLCGCSARRGERKRGSKTRFGSNSQASIGKIFIVI